MLAGVALAAGAESAFPAVRADGPIKLDGKLDDPAWEKALAFNQFYVQGSGEPGFPTEAKLLYDDDALYIGFRCPTPPGGSVTARETKRDGKVYSDDCVEIMIDPNKTGDRYFHILVNPNGAIMDRYCDQGGHVGDAKWNGDIKAGAFQGDGFWSAEVRVPFSTLDIIPGGARDWGFNFCRDHRNPNQEASTAGGAFNVAGRFLTVTGIDIPLDRYGWETSPPVATTRRDGDKLKVALDTRISNLAARPQSVLVDQVLIGPGGAAVAGEPKSFKPGETMTVTARNLVLDAPGAYRCIVSVCDPGTHRVLKRRTYPLDIRFAPLEITLEKPHYRDAIFASQKLPEVVYTVKSNLVPGAVKSIDTGIRTLDGKVLADATLTGPTMVKIPAGPLPEAKMEIFAIAKNAAGQSLGEAVHPLRKLPYRKGEVWLDEERFWRVDGQRYFLLGEWNDVHVPGLMVTVGEAPAEPGGKFITGTLAWSSFPARKSYKLPSVNAEDEKIIRETVRKYAANPDLFGYYLSDEPEITGISASGLTHAATIIRDEDPYHPIIISNDTVVGSKDFADAAEINGLHPYPNPARNEAKSNFSKVVTFMDQAIDFNRNRRQPQTVAYLQQGFNYGDHGAADSRIPSYDEIRTQYLMTLIMGGRGILTYNRTTPHYPELYLGMPEMVKEVRCLAPVLLEDDVADPADKVDNANVRMLVKQHDGAWWIFAVSTTPGKEKARFTLPALGDRELQVVSEDRTVKAAGGQFDDVFDNYQVHIYTTDTALPKLKSVAAIEAEIAAANARRAKPGNLAFQMFEHDKLKISASSNKAMARRADSNLWHVTDGVIVDYENRAKPLVIWSDNTPNQAPDWIELDFGKPVTMGRVVVYPGDDSLKDYEVQTWQDGRFETAGTVRDAQGKMQEIKFKPLANQRLRIYITATRGAYAQIDEIEVYAQ